MVLSFVSNVVLLLKTAADPGITQSFTLESRCMFVGELPRAVAPLAPASRQGPLEHVESQPEGEH